LAKISQLKQKLKTANLDGELGNLVKMLGDETVSKILEKSAGKSLKEVALILLNNLDQAENFTVSNKLWRFLFALSKSPYVVERIMQDPQLLTL
jgi:hypothetical protein